MAKRPHDELLDHEYDGIREYDNPCPTWWNYIFFSTFVFSVLYFLFFHVGIRGWTLAEAYEGEVADNLRLRFSEIGQLKPDQATLIEYMQKPDWLAVGAGVFKAQCKSCHGDDGSGLVGPNLTDNYYKNVKTLTDVAKVVEDGAANGAMPAWRNRLHPNEIVLVSACVANMRGKDLPGPRGPEGEKIPPWPTAAEKPAEAKPEAAKPASEKPAGDEPATSAAKETK